MSLISPNFDVKSIIFSQFWPGAFSQNCWKRPCIVVHSLSIDAVIMSEDFVFGPGSGI